jgi:MarR family transcriptional regulator for hemolysin
MVAVELHRLLVMTYLLLDDGDHQVLGSFGLTPTQYTVLSLLDPEHGRRASDLLGPLLLEKSSLSRLLDRLVAQRLVCRVSDPRDRRSQLIVLTHEGLTRRDLARQLYERSLAERLSGLADGEREQLTALLNKLHQQLQAQLRTA